MYYESNHNDAFVKRILKSLRVSLPMIVCLILLLVPTYYMKALNTIDIDVDSTTAEKFKPTLNVEPYQADFLLHAYIVTVWLGELLFAIFGGVGLITLPYDYLMDFIYRPTPIKEKDFNKRKNILLPLILKLREDVKRLDKERFNVENMQGLTGYWKRYLFNRDVRVLET